MRDLTIFLPILPPPQGRSAPSGHAQPASHRQRTRLAQDIRSYPGATALELQSPRPGPTPLFPRAGDQRPIAQSPARDLSSLSGFPARVPCHYVDLHTACIATLQTFYTTSSTPWSTGSKQHKEALSFRSLTEKTGRTLRHHSHDLVLRALVLAHLPLSEPTAGIKNPPPQRKSLDISRGFCYGEGCRAERDRFWGIRRKFGSHLETFASGRKPTSIAGPVSLEGRLVRHPPLIDAF